MASSHLLGADMFKNNLREHNKILYRLKRSFGLPVVFKFPTKNEYNVETGVADREFQEISVRRAIVLPAKVTRDFVYDLAYIASNKNFTEGGFFDKTARNVIVRSTDLKGYTPNLEWEATFKGKDYVVKDISETEDSAGYIFTCTSLDT